MYGYGLRIFLVSFESVRSDQGSGEELTSWWADFCTLSFYQSVRQVLRKVAEIKLWR